MKQFFFVVVAFFAASVHSQAQVITDKKAFAKAFVSIFSQRATGFDSLAQVLENPGVDHSAILPKAKECYVSSNYIFGAYYDFDDSTAAAAFFKELKQLITFTATSNGVAARFKPVDYDPELNQFFFLDAAGYTNNNCSIDFEVNEPEDSPYDDDEEEEDEEEESTNKSRPKAATYTVRLLIGPGDQYCYYTSYGDRVNDPELKALIQSTVFGTDTALVAVKTNKRIENEETVYSSKLNVSGFTTKIIEAKGRVFTGYHVYLSKDFTTTESAFLEEVNQFVLKMKAALPEDYSFTPYPDEHYLSFQPVHYNTVPGNIADIIVEYNMVEGKKDTYNLQLHIVRTAMNK